MYKQFAHMEYSITYIIQLCLLRHILNITFICVGNRLDVSDEEDIVIKGTEYSRRYFLEGTNVDPNSCVSLH